MRTITLAIVSYLVAIAHAPSYAQNKTALSLTFDSSSFLQGSYAEKLKMYQKEPIQNNCIIFLGNSLTSGGNWQSFFPNQTVLNRGIGGDVTAGLFFRLDEITRHKPSKLFIEIGTNDLSRGLPTHQILENFQKIVNRIKVASPSTLLYIQSLLPINPLVDPSNTTEKQRRILELNHALEEFSLINQVLYVPLHAAFVDEKQNLKKELTNDGLHLTPKGYEVWSAFLKKRDFL